MILRATDKICKIVSLDKLFMNTNKMRIIQYQHVHRITILNATLNSNARPIVRPLLLFYSLDGVPISVNNINKLIKLRYHSN